MKQELIKIVDPNTGEKVSKCPLTQDFQAEMDKALAEHNNMLNQFMLISQQTSELTNKWLEMRKEIKETDEKFKHKLQYIAKKLKLVETDPWTYNLQEKCFELREPPDIEPLTASQIGEQSGT